MINQKRIEEIRILFEKRAIDKSLLINLYKSYNPIEDIETFVSRAGQLFPNLNCGLTSIYLQHIFQEGRIINGRYGDNPHTFLMINDQVIDITADQYGGPRVYIGPLTLPWQIV